MRANLVSDEPVKARPDDAVGVLAAAVTAAALTSLDVAESDADA
jgi:hypothetical protein